MKASRLKNQKGQVILENILLMVIIIGVFSMIIQALLKDNFNTRFTDGAWGMMDGMIQCGSWQPCGVGKAKINAHPNSSSRVLSLRP